MKNIGKLISVISIMLVIILIVEPTIGAISPTIKGSEIKDAEAVELADDSEVVVTSDLIMGEITSERTEFTKSFRLENGNNMIVEYAMPIHFQSANGQWQDYDYSMISSQKEIIDTSRISTADETDIRTIDVYSAKDSLINVSFAKNSDEEDIVYIGTNDNTVSWSYAGMNRTTARVIESNTEHEGNERFTVLDNLIGTVRYDSAYQNVDIECISSPLGVKENIILWNSNASNTFTMNYHIGSLTPKQLDDRNIALLGNNGEAVYYISAPYMIDSQNKISEDVKLTMVNYENNMIEVEIYADADWLNNAERSYPVTIDPTFTTGQHWGDVQCAYLDKGHPNTAYGYGSSTGYTGTFYVGGYSSIADTDRGLIKLNNLPALNKGDMIVDATINLLPYNLDYTEDMYVCIYEATSSWSQDTVTWNNQPSCSSTMTDYSNMYTDLIDNNHYSWNITKLVKQWYNGSANNGFFFKSTPPLNHEQAAGFYSSNYPLGSGPRPLFALTYRNNKGIEDYWTTTSFSVGKAGLVYINDYTGSLTFITSMASTASPVMPAGISYVYNSYMAKEKYDKSTPYTGRGWRMNIQQTIKQSSLYGLTGEAAENYPYVYTDADGTEHYFYKKIENNVTKYYDEDGLGFELTRNLNDSAERFTITDKDKNKLIFNSYGILRKIKDKSGNQVLINGSQTNISQVTDASGFKLTFDLNNNSYITQINDPDGKEVSITHATIGDTGAFISRITRDDGTHADFTYDADGLMTSITDSDGYRIEISYDSSGTKKVTEIVEYGTDNSVGNKITFDRTKYNTTVIQSSGIDGVWNNSDDYLTTYQFDNYGRTVSVKGKTKGGKSLGASNYEYTAGEPNSTGSNVKYTNRLTKQHSLGSNTVNYMRNHSFESSASWANAAWGGTNTFTGSYVSSQRIYGQKSYRIQSTAYEGTSSARAYQDITGLNPGSTYTLSGYVKVTDFSGSSDTSGVLIGATSFNSDNTMTDFLSDSITRTTDSQINEGWRRLSITFTLPSNSTSVRVNIALRAATGTVYFDAMQLEKGSASSTYNLIENSSFESYSGATPTSWAGAGSINLSSSGDTVTTAHYQTGSTSFRIKGDVSLNKGLIQTVPVSGTEEDTYIVSGWVMANAVPTDAQRKVKLTITVVYGDNSTKNKSSADFNPSVSGWQYVSKAFTLSDETSANKTPKEIRIGINYSKQANTAYFDNISLVKEPVASYTYDNEGNLISVSANAQQNSTLEYNADNQVTRSVDPKGGEYTYTYDDLSRLHTATIQSGAVYTYSYDGKGNVSELEGSFSDNNTTTKIKSTQSINQYPTSSSTSYTVTNHDTRNIQSSATYNAKSGTLTSTTDSTGTTSYTYNTDNDALLSVTKGSNTVSYTYDNSYKYLMGVASPTTNYYFDYDAFGNRTSTAVGNRTLASYTYGAGGSSLTQMNYGNGDYVTYSYDAYGNVSQRKVNGNTVYQGFADNSGAITKERDFANDLQYNYTYDTTDRLISTTILATGSNSLTRLADFEYNYDLNNNVTKLATSTPYGTFALGYTYGDDNVLTQTELPNSKLLDYSRDKFGRLLSSSLDTAHSIDKTYTYLASDYGSGYTTSLIETETIGSDTYKYAYDNAGNITGISRKGPNDNVFTAIAAYTYDGLNRLTRADDLENDLRYEYTYTSNNQDQGGNIQAESIYVLNNGTATLLETKTYTYGNNNWRDLLTEYNGQGITYDDIGNPLTYRDGISFTWSNGRELSRYQKGTYDISYTYDVNGMRLSKNVNGTQYTYLYFGGLLMQETVGEKILNFFYDSNGQAIGFKYRSTPNSTGAYYYYMHNSRGDILGFYNSSGDVYVTYTYDAWGLVTSVKNSSGQNVISPDLLANIQPLRYRGYVYDNETGLYYLQSRYYDPVTRRFINADELVSTGTGVLGYNMFAYCNNNSTSLVDDGGNRPTAGTSLKDETAEERSTSCPNYETRKAVKERHNQEKVMALAKAINPFYCDTYAIGVTLSGGAGAYGSISRGIAFDYNGNIAIVNTISFGGSSPSASISCFFGAYSINDINNLSGYSFLFGDSVDLGASIGIDYSTNGSNNLFTGTIGVGVSPIAFEFHSGTSYTWISSRINIFNFTPIDLALFLSDLL